MFSSHLEKHFYKENSVVLKKTEKNMQINVYL